MRPLERSNRFSGGHAVGAPLLVSSALSAATLANLTIPALFAALCLLCCAPYTLATLIQIERERYWRACLRAERARRRYLSWSASAAERRLE